MKPDRVCECGIKYNHLFGHYCEQKGKGQRRRPVAEETPECPKCHRKLHKSQLKHNCPE